MDRRVTIGLVAVAVVAALFFVFRPQDDDAASAEDGVTLTRATTPQLEPVEPTTEETTPRLKRTIPWRIDARDGRLDRLRVPVDATLALTVVADTSDHVHVHGYDLMRDVAPGRPARLRFETTLTGRFEIELEDAGQLIARLTVVG